MPDEKNGQSRSPNLSRRQVLSSESEKGRGAQFLARLRAHLRIINPLKSSFRHRAYLLNSEQQSDLIVRIRQLHPYVADSVRAAEERHASDRDGGARSASIFRARRRFDKICKELGFPPGQYDVTPAFVQLVQ